MQDILVYTDDFRRPWKPAIEYAAHLAVTLGASLSGAYVYPSPLYTAPRFSAPDLIAAIWENVRMLRAEAEAAGEPFIESARALGVRRASWHVAEGYVPDGLAQIGTWHDLLVLDVNDDETWGAPFSMTDCRLMAGLPSFSGPATA